VPTGTVDEVEKVTLRPDGLPSLRLIGRTEEGCGEFAGLGGGVVRHCTRRVVASVGGDPDLSVVDAHRRVTVVTSLDLSDSVVTHHSSSRTHGASVVDLTDLVEVDARSLSRLELAQRSEEHTSELQSRENIVCHLMPEKNTQSHHTK